MNAIIEVDASIAQIQKLLDRVQYMSRHPNFASSSAFEVPLDIPHPRDAPKPPPKPEPLPWSRRIALGCLGCACATVSASGCIALMLSLVNT